MSFVVYIVVSAIALLVVSRLLAGFQVSNWFTALATALILALFHAIAAPIATVVGRKFGEILAQSALGYPFKIALSILFMLVIDAIVLKLVSRIGPGFYIDNLATAIIAAALIVSFNVLLGEAAEFVLSSISDADQSAIIPLLRSANFPPQLPRAC